MFSPSQTKTFSRCKFKWFLQKCMGTDYSTIGKRDLAACVGTAVGAMFPAYYLHDRKLTQNQLIELVISRYHHEVKERCTHGREVQDCEEAIKYPEMLPHMVEAVLKAKPIPDDWKVLNAEAAVSDEYNAYLDLAGICQRGLWIADVKCKMQEKIGYMQNSLLKYQFDPQLLQYVREWSKKQGQQVEFYRIIYVVGSPVAACTYQDFEIDWDHMALREMSDATIWSDMAAANLNLKHLAEQYGGYSKIPLEKVMLHAPMAPEHMDGFYKCDMWDPCLLYAGDAAASPNYIQIERKL